MPPQSQDVCGVRFKVTRVGSPGQLLYRLGRTKGGSEIASGAIAADDVVPLYELLYGGDFPAQKVLPGQKLYLTLLAQRGKYPEDYYLVYGPRPGRGARPTRKASLFLRQGRRDSRFRITCGRRWDRVIRPGAKSGLRLSGR